MRGSVCCGMRHRGASVLLAAAVKQGVDGGEGAWLLALELLQWQQDRDAFENLAVVLNGTVVLDLLCLITGFLLVLPWLTASPGAVPSTREFYRRRVQRIEEVARMLGGVEITSTTRRHAREMLSAA